MTHHLYISTRSLAASEIGTNLHNRRDMHVKNKAESDMYTRLESTQSVEM